jgi:4-hydroxybenzoate polyprenyltransferase
VSAPLQLSVFQHPKPLLQLIRPANLVTASADILAGYAAAGSPNPRFLGFLIASSVALYAGGVVLNDVFDADLDATERPERPIPSGRISVRTAASWGVGFLALGVILAAGVSRLSLAIAALIALLATLYDWRSKHHAILGPVNMAACRSLNLLLGVSAAPALLAQRWYLALIPLLYVGAITILSKGEVHGGRKNISLVTLLMISSVIVGVLVLGKTAAFAILASLPFVLLFAWRVFPPFFKAYAEPKPETIRRAVLAGVLSLIVLDSALAAGYAGIFYGACVLSLSLVAGGLARLFAVT